MLKFIYKTRLKIMAHLKAIHTNKASPPYLTTLFMSLMNSKSNLSRPKDGEIPPKSDLSKFVYTFSERKFDFYEYFKMALGIILVPARILLIIPIILLANFLISLSRPFLFISDKENGKLNILEKIITYPIRFLSRVFLFVLGFYYIKVNGKPDPDVKLIVSNHVSCSDILFFLSNISPSFVSKESVSNLPFISFIATFLKSIYIDRRNKKSREKALYQISKRALNGSNDTFMMQPLVIFPEGTTTNGRCLIPFKRGAFKDGMPVTPVVIRYHFKHFDPAYTGVHKQGGEFVRTGGFLYFWQFLSQFSHSLEVDYLPTYFPAKEEKNKPHLYAENVRNKMAEFLKVEKIDVKNYIFK